MRENWHRSSRCESNTGSHGVPCVDTPTTRLWMSSPHTNKISLTIWADSCIFVACWRLFCRVLKVLLLFLLAPKAEVATLLRSCCLPTASSTSQSTGLSPGGTSMLWILHWKTQIFLPQLTLMGHPGWIALPEPLVWVVDSILKLPLE